MPFEIFYRLAARFRVRIDEVIERVAFLIGRKTNIAPVSKKHAIGIQRAEKIVFLLGMLGGFGGVDGDPPNTVDKEFRPAMIARDFAFALPRGNLETNFESRGNSRGAHHADENGMKVGAVPVL